MTLSAIKTARTRGPLQRMAPYDPPNNKVSVRKHIKHAYPGKSVTVGLSRLRPAVHPGPATTPNNMNTSTNQFKYNRSTYTYYG